MESKACQTCQKSFTIEPEDFDFYKKIKVLPPTLCFECRQQRRYAWRNERTLYRRNCDLCAKSTVTIYSPDKPFRVYCVPCWWGDGWDTADYGRDFDFSRPFFEQFSELQHEVPRMALLTKNSVNSEYTNHSGDNKNVYLSFACFGNENVWYSTWTMQSRDCMDSGFIYEKGERLYEMLDSRSVYQCQYGLFLKDCSNCYYCYDSHGCNNCFMSSNLRNKSYVFRNEQLTREQYLEKMKEIDLSSFQTRQDLEREFTELRQRQSIHRYSLGERNVESSGSLLFDCRNVTQSFEISKGENNKYMYGGIETKDCMDLYHVGYNVGLSYECQGCTRVYDCQFCHLCYDNASLQYCDSCQNSQNLFGCVSVKKGEYMIFNKKYSKEEYATLREKIIEHMKKTGEYGEFFPPAIAPVYYNETQGNLYMPLTKEEVLSRGWLWEDRTPGTFGKETIASDAIADRIEEVPDSVLKEIFACSSCSKNYNIIADELSFYRRETLPLPRKCPECRYLRRFALRPERKLWNRDCMCKLDTHTHSGSCSVTFDTPYAPERPETVYCEACYNAEIL